MIVGVEQSWYDYVISGVHDFRAARLFDRKISANCDDVGAFDQDVSDFWFMSIAVVVVNQPSSDQ